MTRLFLFSKRLWQSRLPQDRVSGMTAWNPDGNCEVYLRNGTVPDFVAAMALPDQTATGGAQ
jgi:hypothetical protein